MPSMNVNPAAQGNPLGRQTSPQGFSFAPTYQDYLAQYNAQHGQASEGGGGGNLSQSQWDALGGKGQWNQLGGGMSIGSDDPRWEALAHQLGVTNRSGPDGTINLYGGAAPSDLSSLVDPSRVLSGNDSYATTHSNLTPQSEFAGGGLSDKGWALAALGALGGGMALGGAFGGAGAGLGEGGSMVGNAGDAGYAGAFDSGGAAAGGSAGGLPESYWSQLASSGQLGSDASAVDAGANGLESASGGYGGLDPETASGQYGGMGVSQNGIGPGSVGNTLQGAMNNPSSLLSGDGAIGRAGSALGSGIGNNPLQAARVAGGLYALGSAGHSSGANTTNGGGGNGASTDPASIIEAMANANRVNQTTPFGARTWSQDPSTGRWSVADTMSPEEQSNYEGVRGMNADVTSMARQRLAALMSKPASARVDRPISFRLHGG